MVLTEQSIRLAAAFVDDAWSGRHDDEFKRPGWQKIFSNMRPFRTLCILALVLLSFFQTPAWCTKDATDCGSQHGSPVPSSGVPKLSPNAGSALELVILLMLLTSDLSELAGRGATSYFRLNRSGVWRIASAAVVVISIFDVVRLMASPTNWALSPLIRPLVIAAANSGVRHHISSLALSLPEFTHVLILLAILLTFFAGLASLVLYGTELFKDSDNGVPQDGDFFVTFSQSFWNLYILLTTSNFPDIMMPAYNERRAVVGLFIGLNLVLALVYSSYMKQARMYGQQFQRNRAESLARAFRLVRALDHEGGGFLSREALMRLLTELNEYHNIPFVSDEQATLLLDAMDHNEDGAIEYKEFKTLTSALAIRFESVSKHEERRKREEAFTQARRMATFRTLFG